MKQSTKEAFRVLRSKRVTWTNQNLFLACMHDGREPNKNNTAFGCEEKKQSLKKQSKKQSKKTKSPPGRRTIV
jgi:hypothetical protein